MFAGVLAPDTNEFVIENWKGGISMWAPGGVITRSADGTELNRLN